MNDVALLGLHREQKRGRVEGEKGRKRIEEGERKEVSALSRFAVVECGEDGPQKVDALVLRLTKGALEMSKGIGFSSRQTFPRNVVSNVHKTTRKKNEREGRMEGKRRKSERNLPCERKSIQSR